MWSKPHRRPKPIPEPTPPAAVLEEIETEFHQRPWIGASSGGMIVPNEQQPQSEAVERWTPPPPPWSEDYQGEPEDSDEPAAEPDDEEKP